MLGYEITLSDGSWREVEATGYDVTDDGILVVSADDEIVETLRAGEWRSVAAIGVRLSFDWPYRHMSTLLEQLADLLVVKYGYVLPEGLGEPEEYASGLVNELDTFVRAVLARAGIDPESSYDRDRIDGVRAMVINEFDVELPSNVRNQRR